MSVVAKVSLGTVNYTDWLRVTAAPVGDEGNIIYENWFDVPATTFFYLTLPQPINYIIKFYDAPTNTDAGLLLQPSLIVNGLDASYQLEERWYEIGNMPTSDAGTATLDVTGKIITDPYLNGKEIFQFDKEGLRPLKAPVEVIFDNAANTITFQGNLDLSPQEKFRILIKNKVGSSNSSPSGFAGTIDVTAATYTVQAADVYFRYRLVGTAATQVITLPALSGVPLDGFFYFDNTVGGTAVQPRLLTNGTDRILYNGFLLPLNQFAEFWVSKGKTLKLQNAGGLFWEVIGNYDGDTVGERFAGTYYANNCVPEDGRLMDGDEYPRLWFWLNNILPVPYKIIDNRVGNPGFNHNTGGLNGKIGAFIIHPTLKKFIMPDTRNLFERGEKSFTVINNDAERFADIPGGYQADMVGPHNHTIPIRAGRSDNANDRDVMLPGGTTVTDVNPNSLETRPKNFAVIYQRRI